MMEPVIRVDGDNACAERGRVHLDVRKALWRGPLLIGALAAPFFFTWSAFVLFLGLSYFTLLFGHSIGMHRMMIHRAFKCPNWLERSLIYLGVLVGMGGPFKIIETHDIRDWSQRQPDCHDFFSHKRGYLRDVVWQLFYRFEFENPPTIQVEDDIAHDPWLVFFEKTWWLHQIALGGVLLAIGGISWVLWGICVRVFMSIWGHWSVTYVCHNPGPGRWQVDGAGVQASNLRFAGFLTHGECWHNNHHAFPESAQIGLDAGQTDPAWAIISVLEKIGLAQNVGRPRAAALRDDLVETQKI